MEKEGAGFGSLFFFHEACPDYDFKFPDVLFFLLNLQFTYGSLVQG